MTAVSYIVNRLKEPSSWAGIAALLGLLHVQVPLAQFQAAVPALTLLAGLVAILVQEGGSSARAAAPAPKPVPAAIGD